MCISRVIIGEPAKMDMDIFGIILRQPVQAVGRIKMHYLLGRLILIIQKQHLAMKQFQLAAMEVMG